MPISNLMGIFSQLKFFLSRCPCTVSNYTHTKNNQNRTVINFFSIPLKPDNVFYTSYLPVSCRDYSLWPGENHKKYDNLFVIYYFCILNLSNKCIINSLCICDIDKDIYHHFFTWEGCSLKARNSLGVSILMWAYYSSTFKIAVRRAEEVWPSKDVQKWSQHKSYARRRPACGSWLPEWLERIWVDPSSVQTIVFPTVLPSLRDTLALFSSPCDQQERGGYCVLLTSMKSMLDGITWLPIAQLLTLAIFAFNLDATLEYCINPCHCAHCSLAWTAFVY